LAALGLGTLLLLIAGPILLKLHGADTPAHIGLYIAASCILWIVLGLLLRIRMFHFAGWFGLSLVFAWVLYLKGEDWTWWTYHAMWLPVALFFGWLAWITRRISKGNSLVLLSICTIQWFMPDALGLFMHGASGLAQGILMVKIVLAGFLLFSIRKFWI
jgi:hypothetical protein